MIGNYEEYPEMLNRLFLEDKTKGFDAKTEGLYARTITFPTAFTQISIPVIAHAYGGNRNINARITAKSVTTLTAYCEDPLFWIAIGY